MTDPVAEQEETCDAPPHCTTQDLIVQLRGIIEDLGHGRKELALRKLEHCHRCVKGSI